MLDSSALKSFHPFVATPCYGGAVFYNYVLSIISLVDAANTAGMRIDFKFVPGDSLVTRARNDCVAAFLANPSYTHLFWIDGDIGFAPDAAMRLLLSGHDVAAGAYPIKRENWPPEGVPQGTTKQLFDVLYTNYPVNTGGETGEVRLDIDVDGFLKVREAPTGFMVIKRSVFKALIERYPDYRYTPDWPEGTYPTGGVHYRFFDTMIDPVSNRYLSEDYAFCRLLQPLGIDIYIDAQSRLTHHGTKMFVGNLPESLARSPARAVGATKGLQMIVTGLENLK